MDEPFSALDLLTAETLRTDFLDLWTGQQLSTRAALLVTHNIEEAVLMCDRIVVLASNPAHIAAEVPVSLTRPRDRLEEAFRGIVDQIYSILTSRSLESIGAERQLRGGAALPRVSVNQISGLIEKFAALPTTATRNWPRWRRSWPYSPMSFPTAEALHMLAFAQIKQNALRLTAAGRIYAQSDTEARKRLFREHLLQFVPLAAHIHRVLEEREDHQAPRLRFETELEDHLTRQDAERTLRVVTGWGRYAELFSYDDRTRRFAVPV